MPEKPTYFNCDEIELDSEDEQAIGENNYIEIEAMPLDRRNRPPNEAPEQVEEEKKEPEKPE